MTPSDLEEDFAFTQKLAEEGKKPHQILRALFERSRSPSESTASYFWVVCCLWKAFSIPLKLVQEIGNWNGVGEHGYLTDEDIDELLGPWIERFHKQ